MNNTSFITYSCSEKELSGNLSILPNEVLAHIFSYIPSHIDQKPLFSVCKRFAALAAKSFYSNRWLAKASFYQSLFTVKRLLKDERAEPSVKNNFALSLSISSCSTSIALELLDHPKLKLAEETSELFDSAVRYGLKEVVERFLKYPNIETIVDLQRLFLTAVKSNQREIVEIFLKQKRIDPSENLHEVFRLAISDEMRTELVKDERIQKILKNNKKDDFKPNHCSII